jgi:glycosyltransferase involved in cell wall biosynthesis
MSKKQGLSIFFPCYNDAGTIASLVVLADRTARQFTDDYEIIVVNDGSSDHSSGVLEELQKKYKVLKVINHIKNRGYGGALRSGFDAATKELVFYTDGDFQYDVTEMGLLYEKMEPGIDWVNGWKISRNDAWYRKAIGKLYNFGVKTIFNIKISDIDCDYRLLRKSAVDKIDLSFDSGVICLELIKKLQLAGCRAAEAPVNHFFRSYGKSQFFNFRRVFRTFWNLLQLWIQIYIKKSYRKKKDI